MFTGYLLSNEQTLWEEKQPLAKEDDKSRIKAVAAARLSLDMKALDLTVLETTELVSYADYLVICTGTSIPHVQSIVDNIESGMRALGIKPQGREGLRRGQWALLDYGDVVVHVFDTERREYYALDKLWLDAPVIKVHEVKADEA
jgi:ribosome-associated protein